MTPTTLTDEIIGSPTTLTDEITGSPKRNLKKKKKTHTYTHIFVGTMITKVSRNLRINLNQSLKPDDDQFTGILKNVIKT